METKLSKDQNEYLNFLVKKVMNASDSQILYIDCLKKEKSVKVNEETYLWNNIDWVSFTKAVDVDSKNVYRDFIDQQITLSEYIKWVSTQPKLDLGLGFAAAPQDAAKLEKTEKKVEVKEEKKVRIYFYLFYRGKHMILN